MNEVIQISKKYFPNEYGLIDFITCYRELSRLEKVQYMLNIAHYLDSLFRKYDLNDSNKWSDLEKICLYLESSLSLMKLYTTILNQKQNMLTRFDLENISKRISNISIQIAELMRKQMNLYFKEGLSFQLKVTNNFKKSWHYFDNMTLSNSCEEFMEMICSLYYFENNLHKIGINSNILEMFYQELSGEELAFIYAQFSSYDKKRDYYVVHRELLYRNLACRSFEDKVMFMKTIKTLGYCDLSEGVCSILMSLEMDHESKWRLLETIFLNEEHDMNDEELFYSILEYSEKISSDSNLSGTLCDKMRQVNYRLMH